MRHQQASDDGQAKRPARLGARAPSEGDRQRPHQRGERRHRDRPEAHHTRFMNGLERLLAMLPLCHYSEVDHHDAVLLHESDEHDDADKRIKAQLGPENQQRQERAEPGRWQMPSTM
jgi:hypothetical protein